MFRGAPSAMPPSSKRPLRRPGGSLRDVQELAGHTSLATTQRYIQGDTAAKRNVIKLIWIGAPLVGGSPDEWLMY
jgi:hypothetical protein